MSKEEKLISRLAKMPNDFTFTEAKTLLTRLGFVEHNKGKTSGSRVMFYRSEDMYKIMLHKPHPGDVMKHYMVKDLYENLKKSGAIK